MTIDFELPHAPIHQPYSRWPLWVAYESMNEYWLAGRIEAAWRRSIVRH